MTSKNRKALEASMGISLNGILRKTRETGFSGRCWGIGESRFKGSHVTLSEGDEIVSAYVKDGKIHILECKKTSGTALGKKVRKILEAKNLPMAD